MNLKDNFWLVAANGRLWSSAAAISGKNFDAGYSFPPKSYQAFFASDNRPSVIRNEVELQDLMLKHVSGFKAKQFTSAEIIEALNYIDAAALAAHFSQEEIAIPEKLKGDDPRFAEFSEQIQFRLS